MESPILNTLFNNCKQAIDGGRVSAANGYAIILAHHVFLIYPELREALLDNIQQL